MQKLSVINPSQDDIFPPIKIHIIFSLQSNGIDKQHRLCFDQSFGMFGTAM